MYGPGSLLRTLSGEATFFTASAQTQTGVTSILQDAENTGSFPQQRPRRDTHQPENVTRTANYGEGRKCSDDRPFGPP